MCMMFPKALAPMVQEVLIISCECYLMYWYPVLLNLICVLLGLEQMQPGPSRQVALPLTELMTSED